MKQKWQSWISREGVDVTTLFFVEKDFYKIFWDCAEEKKEYIFVFIKNRVFTQYISIDIAKVARHYYHKIFKNPETIKRFYQQGKRLLKNNENKIKKWQKNIQANENSAALTSALKDFTQIFQTVDFYYNVQPFLIMEVWQKDLDEIINRLIDKNKLADKRELIINSIYRPWRKTALLELQERLGKGENIDKLVKRFQFLRSWIIILYRPIDKKWLKNLRSGKGLLARQRLYPTKTLLKMLKPNSNEKYFLTMAPYIIFFKDWRDDLRRKVVYEWNWLFHKIAFYLKLPYSDLSYLTLPEITLFLKQNRVDKKLINLRKKHGCLITIDKSTGKVKVVDHPLPKRYNLIIKQKNEQNKKTISGPIAQTGKAVGRVIIMKSFHDIKKFRGGEILVANTTHPNYLPAMRKAAAFVTNEGGVICHAAIVARELKKPCIVGTKIATKVLKDGDRVLVDADKGIVRKI